MNDCLLTFRSVTGAQRAMKVLGNNGIRAQLSRTPKSLAENGCGYCLRIREAHCTQAAALLRQNGLQFSRAYRLGERMEEVAL